MTCSLDAHIAAAGWCCHADHALLSIVLFSGSSLLGMQHAQASASNLHSCRNIQITRIVS